MTYYHKWCFLLRSLYRSGSESLQSTIEAIVKNDNDELLQKFIEDEDIVDDGNIRKGCLVDDILSPILSIEVAPNFVC